RRGARTAGDSRGYEAGTGLAFSGGMVDTIIRVTVMAVLTLALLNALHGTSVLVRLARQLARRAPHGGLIFWLPAFGSMRDVRIWIARWRGVLDSRDPALIAVRVDARTVIRRHVHLTVLAHTWAVALAAVAPNLV